jgi:hypothetical protein
MAIVVQQITPPPTLLNSPPAQLIVNSVTNDLLFRMGPNHPSLLDYINRIQLDMLKRSRWQWLWSPIQQFITQKGQTDYWIGTASPPANAVPTGLNLADVQFIKADSVFDRSNGNTLGRVAEQPNFSNFRDGSSREGIPANWRYDPDTPSVLNLYPAANNQNGYQPVPETPLCATVVGGALPLREYFVQITLVDSQSGESLPSKEAVIRVPSGSLLVIQPPVPAFPSAATGERYNQWNCYVSSVSGGETKQNTSLLSTANPFTEPSSGLITGSAPPTTATIAQLGGYVIQFRYFRQRPQVTSLGQLLYIPIDYMDVVIAGVNWLGYKYLASSNKSFAQDVMFWGAEYERGKIGIIRDQHLFPANGTFMILPDSASSNVVSKDQVLFF